MKVNVNIIDVWQGDRHERLRALWRHWACLHAHSANLYWFDNKDAKLDHVPCYEAMWKQEVKRPERFAIFTEHDFIPGPAFLLPHLWTNPDQPIVAARYCTRDTNMFFHQTSRPGAWFILIDKSNLLMPHMYFKSGAYDTCNNLGAPLKHNGQEVRLLQARDCFPEHYGLDVLTDLGELVGTHLFWSRHYNDPPGTVVCGFDLDEIRAKIDKVICNAEAWHPATGSREDTLPASNMAANWEVGGNKCPPPDRPQ
jgi:hypothetical protein